MQPYQDGGTTHRVFLDALLDGRNYGIVLGAEFDGVAELNVGSFRCDLTRLGEFALNVGQVLLDLLQACHGFE
jgi:hypothetical protein